MLGHTHDGLAERHQNHIDERLERLVVGQQLIGDKHFAVRTQRLVVEGQQELGLR